jgi:protease I
MPALPKDIYQPETANRNISTGEILIITGNDTEDLEFFYPYYRFIEAGYRVDVATPNGGEFNGKHGIGLKETLKVADVDVEDYDLLYLPGGKAPAELMKSEQVLSLTKAFVNQGKPVSAICHGPQILAAARVIKDRKIAAWPEIESEIRAAGATYANQETVVDGLFVTARWPGDLPSHMKQTLMALGKMKSTASTRAMA